MIKFDGENEECVITGEQGSIQSEFICIAQKLIQDGIYTKEDMIDDLQVLLGNDIDDCLENAKKLWKILLEREDK